MVMVDVKARSLAFATDCAHISLGDTEKLEVVRHQPVCPAQVTNPISLFLCLAILGLVTASIGGISLGVSSSPFLDFGNALIAIGEVALPANPAPAGFAFVSMTIAHAGSAMELSKWLDLAALSTGFHLSPPSGGADPENMVRRALLAALLYK